ncbi:endonuclease domain-containing protein [Sphingomonas sp. MMS12-HWE2-04]|uniref:endonuclease domain-containing protein n=1 Tax=Sphingomonas sp. MMS12-HWE2-04 TaxID=3234199 RepID=UPI00384AE558
MERKLWAHLRNRQLDGAKFKFQATIGPFAVDFVCADKRLVVELDGGQHNETVDRPRSDLIEAEGYTLIRFWNNDVAENLDGVLQAISAKLATLPSRHPSP